MPPIGESVQGLRIRDSDLMDEVFHCCRDGGPNFAGDALLAVDVLSVFAVVQHSARQAMALKIQQRAVLDENSGAGSEAGHTGSALASHDDDSSTDSLRHGWEMVQMEHLLDKVRRIDRFHTLQRSPEAVEHLAEDTAADDSKQSSLQRSPQPMGRRRAKEPVRMMERLLSTIPRCEPY